MDHDQQNAEIAQRLQSALIDQNLTTIGTATGCHPETVRRYMSGNSKIPAAFIGKVSVTYSTDVKWLILGHGFYPEPAREPNLQKSPTDALINELGRRMKMIEDCAVGSAASSFSTNGT